MCPVERFTFDQRTQEILEDLTIPFAIYQYIDKRVVTIVVSRGFCDEFGFADKEDAYQAMDSDMYRATHPDDKTRVADAAYRFAAFDEPYDIVYRTRTLKGPEYIVLHSFGKSIYPQSGVRLCLTWYAFEGRYYPDQGTYESILNQTLNRFLTKESEYRGTYYDYMTGLPNMSYFYELAEAGRKRMKEERIPSAILFFDLTDLKRFNRLYGYEEGDRLIRALANLLAEHFSSENCARFAQDHFAAFASEEGLAERLDKLLADYSTINEGKNLPLRIGIYPDRIEEVDIGTACDRAKLAANVRKNRKESYYLYFDMEMMAEEKNRQEIIDNLDRAIEEGWIKVYYQPIVRSTNGKVCDVEALARWQDPSRGLLMPSAFIPVLEESMLIHKLDLQVVRQVLQDMRTNEINGNKNVPVSINFSRADFDSYDLVKEICTLVDEAGIDRKLINIEITESMVGSDFEYMKGQIERFRSRGFQVWMDDFGSGYSSLDVLQSIKFDLIKFDMGFLKKLDEGDDGKIILTEMVKMATSLGVDTVCEGVETAEQVRFLQEIGCSKLQGYYFMRPGTPDQILDKFTKEIHDGFENPREADYYDTMGRLNLFDLSFLANVDDDIARNTFDTVPMGILEFSDKGRKVRFVRTNQSFRDFVNRVKIFDLSDPDREFVFPEEGFGSGLVKAVELSHSTGNRTFVDEVTDEGLTVHSFVRIIGRSPVSGKEAVAMAILSVREPDENMTYADIARSLAADYYNIFLIDLDTNDYIEYTSKVGDEEMSLERHGEDFFESARRDTMTRIYEEDREAFLTLFTKENVLKEVDTQGVFTTTYRLIDTGTPMYVNMKVTRMKGGNRLILGVSIIDAHMRQQEEEKKLRQERVSLSRIAALSPDYIVLYLVDPLTDNYTQYNTSSEFASLGLAAQGEDFFEDVRLDAPKVFAPEDLEKHLSIMTKENILKEIRENGSFVYNYRFRLGEDFISATLRAALIEENDGEKIIIGVTNDEEEYNRRLEEAYKEASSTVKIYTHIAHALARDYTDLYYVNMESEEFIAFHTDDERGVLSEARRGTDFFERAIQEAALYIHADDLENYLKTLNKDFLSEILDNRKVYELIYRRIERGMPFYVQTKISRMEDDERFIVIAIADVDELIRQRQAEERIQEERIIYARLHALTGNFIVVYVVDPKTGDYREFSATDDYVESLAQAKEGTDFFNKVREVAQGVNHPDDLNLFMTAFTRDNILAEIDRSGSFTLGYRLIMENEPIHVQMKAAMVEEKEGTRLIVGLNNIDSQVRQEQDFVKRLTEAQAQANVDALTGVRNKHAYLETEARMDRQIIEHKQPPFAVVMLDVNDLKLINDTEGHQAGDQHLRSACMIICDIFKHSPVFRVGGDEFAVIAQGKDYEHIDRLLQEVAEHNEEASRNKGVVVACGMARFENDSCVAAVFERADHQMYENKNALKTAGKG